MKKIIVAVAAAAIAAGATIAAPTDASAQRGAVAAGVIGGLAAGAIIGSAIANSAPPPPRVYYRPEPDYGPDCRLVRKRVWYEGYGYRWREVEVCR